MSLIKKTFHTSKDKILKKKHVIGLWSMFVMVFMIICMPFYIKNDHALAASGVRIYNYTTKKQYTYTSTQVKVTYNGKKISKDSTPGLIENGIALVSYKDIFAKSKIKAECIYDKKAGTVSISKFGTTIVLKIGSRTAYINGKKVTAPVAPVKIKYVDQNVTKILVPSRFVSENLGFKYTWNKNTRTAAIEGKNLPMLLSYNNGTPFYYKGTQGKVTFDGKTISPGNMPSIIRNNTAMLRAKRVFADSKIKANYKYNSKDKTITLSRNGNTLKMKIGSTTAYHNDKKLVLDTAPMIVKNHDVGTSYVMVPGKITASCLGLNYSWDKSKATSIITSPKQQQPDNKAPELGDEAVTFDPGKILHQMETHKDIIGKSNGVHNISNESKTDEKGTIFSISRDYNKLYTNSETYAIYGSIPFSTVTSQVKEKQLILNVSNLNTVTNSYNKQELNGNVLDTIHLSNVDIYNSQLEFNLSVDNFTYDLSLSSDKRILYVTIYHNILSKVTIGTNDTMDYITLEATKPMELVINQNSSIITLDLPGTKIGFSEQYWDITSAKNLHSSYFIQTEDGSQLIMGLKDKYEYYIAEDGNVITIMFPFKGQADIPVNPSQPQVPAEPTEPQKETPSVEDLSKYEIIIPNPAGFTVKQIKHEDQYSKQRFAIRIPGDYVAYLKNNPVIVNSKVIKDVSVSLKSKNETEVLITTSKLQGYELFADQKFIYVNVGNPREIYKNIVVLDPGHGGPAPGAYYNKTYEKAINFKILYEIGKDFFNSDPSKLKVYYTRESDVDLSLSDRAAFAKKVGADLFVSLHMNASTSSSAYGTEVYYSTSNNKANAAGLNSEKLAKIFVNNLCKTLNMKNRGAKAARYTVVHKNTVPAVLIELGFMSNKNDFAKITNSSFQYEAAKVIYETLLQVFEQYPTGR